MKAVILAAGKGSRLYPLTYHIPKPLLPLANRPTMHYAFDRLKEIGADDICIVVGENESYMRKELGDGSQFGIKLSYVRQPEAKGLAHAVGYAKDFVNGEPFVLYLGDAIYDLPFHEHVKRFLESDAACLTIVMPVEDPRPYGIVTLDEQGHVKQLIEKPKEIISDLCLIGMYYFRSPLWEILPELQPSARGEYEITDAMQLLVNHGYTVLPGVFRGTWYDTGTLNSFLETSHFLSEGKKVIEGEVSGKIGERVVVGPGASVSCRFIEDAVIMPGAKVVASGEITHSLVGGRVTRDGDIVNERVWDDQVLIG
jgi:glucose-1-phosphate thymidylyltransferase